MKINQPLNRIATPLGSFQIEVENLFDHIFGDKPIRDAVEEWRPRALVTESETDYVVSLELTGVEPDAVSIEMKDNQLEVVGEKTAAELADDVRVLRDERRCGKFKRVFEFVQQVNADAIEAVFKNGMLTMTLPKSESVLPRKIKINVAG